MKSKALIAMAVAALFSSAAVAQKSMYSPEASDYVPVHRTADMITGGYQGWGPMPNPTAPGDQGGTYFSDFQSDTAEARRDRALHLSEVNQVREQVWVANAPLREPYSSRQALAAHINGQQSAVGATGSGAGGFGSFRSAPTGNKGPID